MTGSPSIVPETAASCGHAKARWVRKPTGRSLIIAPYKNSHSIADSLWCVCSIINQRGMSHRRNQSTARNENRLFQLTQGAGLRFRTFT
jgi:hypothetical protein